MKKITLTFLIFLISLSAETLFEIKDNIGEPVFSISDDGLRVFNLGDTLMVISASEIRANLNNGKDKGLARSFSVTTSASKGAKALEVTSEKNTMGSSSGEYANFSPDNIFIGLNAGTSITTGVGNAFMGNNAGAANTGGHNNVFIGESAGEVFDGSFGNVFIGQEAAATLTEGTTNTFLGYFAGGQLLGNFNSWGNTYLGASAGRKVSGNYNVMIGESSGENYQASGSTGESNVFVGRYSGQHATGSNNTYIGHGAGQGSSELLNPGNNNVFLGYNAGIWETGSNRLYIDGSGSSSPLIFGTFSYPRMVVINGKDADNASDRTFFSNGEAGGTTAWYNDSDKRLKKNIKTIESALDKILKLRGVTFEWDAGEKYKKGKQIGFLAQEANDVVPEVVDHNEKSDHYSMQYSPLTALLVEAVKEQQRIIEEYKHENMNLKNENAEINERLNHIEKLLNKIK